MLGDVEAEGEADNAARPKADSGCSRPPGGTDDTQSRGAALEVWTSDLGKTPRSGPASTLTAALSINSWAGRFLFSPRSWVSCGPQTAAASEDEEEVGAVHGEGKDGEAVHDDGKEEGLIDVVPVLHAAKVASDDFSTEAEDPGSKTADAEAGADGPSEVRGACGNTGSTDVASGCAGGPSNAAAPPLQCGDCAL